jgi:hypothetical protein
MQPIIALSLLLLLPFLGFFTGLRHLGPLPRATLFGLALGAVGTVVLLWPLQVPPLPPLWTEALTFPISVAGWVGLTVGAVVRVRLDRKR